ncbi:MAG TPA: site-specific integrase [Thermoanaerobaculales bacterium]|nr:site-specific integrase [Thermoanaerobaculales bacterium]HQL30864.1 site-specific integrase [Thermoanaerobaculales bacterium]
MAESLDVVAGIIRKGADRQTLNWGSVTAADTAKVRAALARKYRPATARKMLTALKGALREARWLGLMGDEQYRRAIDLEPFRATTTPPGRRLTAGELGRLLEACASDQTPRGRRDAAIIAVCYGAGLRPQQVAELELSAFDIAGRQLVLESGRGKVRRLRRVPLPQETAVALARWIVERGPRETGALFVAVDCSGRPRSEPIGRAVVNRVVAGRAAEAGLAHYSPQDLMRSAPRKPGRGRRRAAVVDVPGRT